MPLELFPASDTDFDTSAQKFAALIASDPQRYFLTEEDAELIKRRAKAFRAALTTTRGAGTRTKVTLMEKDRARKEAEQLMRRHANMIRASDQIRLTDKFVLRVNERTRTNRTRECPQTRPILTFVGSREAADAARAKHELKFGAAKDSKARAKPAGAERIELFAELVYPDEPIPKHPDELSGGRPWYLGSFKKNPMVVEFPLPPTPMRLVYWARWAGSNCDCGPWSRTCVACLEGAPLGAAALPDLTLGRRRAQSVIITSARPRLPDCTDDVDGVEMRSLPVLETAIRS